jgi:hypothetical protein
MYTTRTPLRQHLHGRRTPCPNRSTVANQSFPKRTSNAKSLARVAFQAKTTRRSRRRSRKRIRQRILTQDTPHVTRPKYESLMHVAPFVLERPFNAEPAESRIKRGRN